MNVSEDTPLAIIGLGYVGLPLAVEFGKQRPTVGFDINAGRIVELQAGEDRTREVEQEDLAAATKLTYTTDLDAIGEARVYIVTVPTPDLAPLNAATLSGRFASSKEHSYGREAL